MGECKVVYKFLAGQFLRGGSEWREVQRLADECRKTDGSAPRLIAGQRSHAARDDAGSLVGYLGVTQMMPGEVELSGMVNPANRCQGIFSRLLKLAVQEPVNTQVETLVLICAPGSEPGLKLLKALSANHDHNEYRMEKQYVPGSGGKQSFSLREAAQADRPEIARQNAIYFGDSGDIPVNVAGVWLAEMNDCPVGKVEARLQKGHAFIYGLGVLPERRRKGYGRQILMLIMDKLASAGATHFTLEVASKNATALDLYQSLGFMVTAEYGYYTLPKQQLLACLTL